MMFALKKDNNLSTLSTTSQRVLWSQDSREKEPGVKLTGGILSAGNLKELLDVGDFGRHFDVGEWLILGYLRNSGCVWPESVCGCRRVSLRSLVSMS